MRKILLNVPLDDLSVDDILEKVDKGERIFHIFINLHKINHFNSSREFANYFDLDRTIFSCDGAPVQWYARFKGFKIKQRYGGVDVMEKFSVMSHKNDFKIYLLGSTDMTLSKCIETLKNNYPKVNIVGFRNGYFDSESEVLKDIIESEANVLFIALPSPRKEILGHRFYMANANLKYVAGVGGAFKIFSGDLSRAPRFIQIIGMEWLYRVVLEPKRLYKRYWIDGLAFLKLIGKDLLTTGRISK